MDRHTWNDRPHITDDTPLRDILDARKAKALARAGLRTVGDAVRAIETHGLVIVRIELGSDGARPRQTGGVTWSALLAIVESAGFNWRTHIRTRLLL
jgi:hypothetical protein